MKRITTLLFAVTIFVGLVIFTAAPSRCVTAQAITSVREHATHMTPTAKEQVEAAAKDTSVRSFPKIKVPDCCAHNRSSSVNS